MPWPSDAPTHARPPNRRCAGAGALFGQSLQGPWSRSKDRPRCTADRPFQEKPEENPRGLVGSKQASKLAAAATAVAAGIEQRSPGTALGAEQPSPSLFVSHTRRCRRRMTIQVAGAAAVRRRRLIDIYGRRTIHAVGWLAGYPVRPSKGCGLVCMCVVFCE